MTDLIPTDAIAILTQAAEMLEERAAAVIAHGPGPDPSWFEADVDLRNAIRGTFQGHKKSAPDDARWIELMTPNVGLAMAEMFKAWARMGRLDPDLLARVGGLETIEVARQVVKYR